MPSPGHATAARLPAGLHLSAVQARPAGKEAEAGRNGDLRRDGGRRAGDPYRVDPPRPMMGAMPEIHDASFKLWYDHPRMVEDLLRGFVPANLVGAFDFDTLEQMPAQYVDEGLRQSRGDAAWRVRFRDAGPGGWLYLLVLLEFQSTTDRFIAARVLAYTGQMYLKLIRNGEVAEDGRLPPVLPVVIYNGRSRWTAADEVGDIVATVGAGLAPFQPRQRYLLLDEHAQRVEDLPGDNVVTAQIALEQGSVEALAPVLRGLGALLSGPRHASLRRAFAEWTRQVVEGSGLASAQPGLPGVLRRLEEAGELEEMGTLLAERIDEFAEKRAAERAAEQHARGLEQERALLARQAARKFGAETAERLAALLAGIDDAERLAGIGEAVIDCADGDALLARAAADGGPG